MASKDLRQAGITDLTNGVTEFSPDAETLDSPGAQEETTYINTEFSQNLGYYHKISQINRAFKTLGTWGFGKGYSTEDKKTEAQLRKITGCGFDSFPDVCFNQLIMKKINGDAFCEIIRNDQGTLINLKPLNCGKMTIVVNKKGLIKRYDYLQGDGETHKFKPTQILHSCNDRVGDEIHGESVIPVLKGIIDLKQESLADWKKILHRSTVRIIYVDDQNDTTLDQLKEDWKDAIDKKEVLVMPGSKKDFDVQDHSAVSITPFLETWRYCDNEFYNTVGVPKVLVTSEGFTEAGSKTGILTFDPTWAKEQMDMESDLWNQAGVKVKFNRPPQLQNNVQEDEAKNTGQVGLQPSDAAVGAAP